MPLYYNLISGIKLSLNDSNIIYCKYFWDDISSTESSYRDRPINNPVKTCFKACLGIYCPKHWTTFCGRRAPNLCRRKLFSLFKAETTSVVGTCELGKRWLSNMDMRVKQRLHWLGLWPPPAPTPVNMKKTLFKNKKKRLLIINWDASVFSLSGIWAMHWLSNPSRAMFLPPQIHIQLQCRVLVFTQTAELLFVSYRGANIHLYIYICLYIYIHMQILHLLWNILTNSLQYFLTQWKAT